MPKGKQIQADNRKEAFAVQYMMDLNGTQAAIRVGFSAKTAAQAASRLLKDVKVQAKIAELTEQASKATGITIERTVKEIARCGFADINQIMRVTEDGVPVIDLRANGGKLPPNAKVRQRTIMGGDPNDSMAVLDNDVEIQDKARYLDMLMKHLGGYAPVKVAQTDTQGNDVANPELELRARLAAVVQRLPRGGAVEPGPAD